MPVVIILIIIAALVFTAFIILDRKSRQQDAEWLKKEFARRAYLEEQQKNKTSKPLSNDFD